MVSALTLNPDESPQVTIMVMKSYDQATAFLNHLRHLLLAVGLGAVLGGSLLVYLIAGTFTRPLEKLVDGVRALGGGDFVYPLQSPAVSEVAELTESFSRMRDSLRQAQQRLLDSERLATIGRMASSISHDLRHPLTAVLANAEFLADADLSPLQREELYLEIRRCGEPADRSGRLAAGAVASRRVAECDRNAGGEDHQPGHRAGAVASSIPADHRRHRLSGLHNAQFDPRKMERVFYNLLLNGCQAAQVCGGHVGVTVADQNGRLANSSNGRRSRSRILHPRQTVRSLRQPWQGEWNGIGSHHRAEDCAGPQWQPVPGKLDARAHGDGNRIAAALQQENGCSQWPSGRRFATIHA